MSAANWGIWRGGGAGGRKAHQVSFISQRKSQFKIKGQQLKSKIVSHFFTLFPPGLSPSKQRVFKLKENKREEKIVKRTGQIDVAR